jgi:dTMP kinase
MYLGGEFGSDPNSVNPYAASSFFAVDRYASFVRSWGQYYNDGGTIITDRYTTSNAIHQGCKLPADQRQEYFRWLYEYEFKYMRLPQPDCVIYMSTPIDVSVKRMRLREKQTNTHADIHEQDNAYLKKCFDCGLEAAAYYGWKKIDSVENGREKTVEQIHDEIYSIIQGII